MVKHRMRINTFKIHTLSGVLILSQLKELIIGNIMKNKEQKSKTQSNIAYILKKKKDIEWNRLVSKSNINVSFGRYQYL